MTDDKTFVGQEVLAQILERLDDLCRRMAEFEFLKRKDGSSTSEGDLIEFSDTAKVSKILAEDVGENFGRRIHIPLPDANLIRRIIRNRKHRSTYFDEKLLADPMWDMLLDLTAARAEQSRVSVTSLCIASGVPPTTALRWIGLMIDQGLCERTDDEADARRSFIALTDKGADAMTRYFYDLEGYANKFI